MTDLERLGLALVGFPLAVEGQVVDRRTFIAVAAPWLTAPLAAEAQPAGRVYRIGYLGLSTLSSIDGQSRSPTTQVVVIKRVGRAVPAGPFGRL